MGARSMKPSDALASHLNRLVETAMLVGRQELDPFTDPDYPALRRCRLALEDVLDQEIRDPLRRLSVPEDNPWVRAQQSA